MERRFKLLHCFSSEAIFRNARTNSGRIVMRVAMISEHASPLAALGGVDSGGQNVYVCQLADALVSAGYKVDVFTRRDHPSRNGIVRLRNNLRVIHVPAGPPRYVRKE